MIENWVPVIPYEYRRGDLYELYSLDCGLPSRWVNLDPTIYGNYYCSGTTKYYKQQRQFSIDGITWYNVVPAQYKMGDVYEYNSTDCGYIPPQYRTTSGTPYCTGYDKYVDVYSQVSYDGGTSWITTATTSTLLEHNSSDCGYVEPQYRWINLDPSVDYYCEEDEYSSKYLTFNALEDGMFSFSGTHNLSVSNAVSYSLDSGTTWSYIGNGLNVRSGDTVMLRGNCQPIQNVVYGIGTFGSTCNFTIEGNPMSLIYYDNFANKTSLSGKGSTFTCLFSGCTKLISAENLRLKPTTLTGSCYNSMFSNCTSLTTAPPLPATTLAQWCYANMFSNCTSLTTAPSRILGTYLVYGCFDGMFEGCTSLETAPEICATSMSSGATQCCRYMFSGCTSLLTPPSILKPTELAKNCYQGMFIDCINLRKAPEISASALAEECCEDMFKNCTKLKESPVLRASYLPKYSYQSMFEGCSSLSAITCYATSLLATQCTNFWVDGVAQNGVFTKSRNANFSIGRSGIPSGWEEINV